MPAIAVAVAVGARSPGGGWNWLAQGIGFYLAATLLGALSAWGYSASSAWHRGILTLFEKNRLQHVAISSAIKAFLVPSAIFGLGMGLLAAPVIGPIPRVGGWTWALFLVGLPLAVYLVNLIGLGLYNRVVVPFYGSLSWEEAPDKDGVRIVAVNPREVRLVAALWLFSWAILLLLLVVVALIVLLTVMANRLPAGYFGLGVALFSGFFLAGVGFLLSVMLGYWCAWGARLYNRWAQAGGGFHWTPDRRGGTP